MIFNGQNICPNCFRELAQPGGCSHCGYTAGEHRYPQALPEGTVLGGHYLLGRVLGQGGFGITYAAWDLSRGIKVALKEFFPESMASREVGTHRVVPFSQTHEENYRFGRRQFLEEAGALSQFTRCPGIVSVYSCFEEKGTAYFTMEFLEGINFKDYITRAGGRISWEEACGILLPVMDALEEVHRAGMVHRDVTPDNIFITREGTVKLLDFGAARYSVGDRSATLDVVLKHGFAPMEQYAAHGRRGPYTDIYSLGACFYLALTGVLPPNALERVNEDELVVPGALGITLPAGAQDAVMRAMAVRSSLRYQSVSEFRRDLLNMGAGPDPGAQAGSGASQGPVPAGKPRKGLVIGLAAAVVVLAAALVTVLAAGPGRDPGLPGEDSVREEENQPARVPKAPSGAPEKSTEEPDRAAEEDHAGETPEEPTGESTEAPTEPPVQMDWLGGVYLGQASGSVPHGQGTLQWDCGSWEGSFVDGLPLGEGFFTGPGEDPVPGSWTWDTVTLYYDQGMAAGLPCGTYEGLLLENVPMGFGRAEYNMGGSYAGSFREGHPQGPGVYTYRSGAAISGDFDWGGGIWSSVAPDKLGTDMYYTGMVLDQEFQGFGLLEFDACGTFYGEFSGGQVDGRGAYYYRCPGSSTYLEGNSWRMVYHEYRLDNDYSGLKLNGFWQGFGIGVMSSGSHYVGEVMNDYRDGYGRVFLNNQTVNPDRCGIFRSGNFQRKLD